MSGYTAPNRLLMPARHSIDTITDSWVAAQDAPSTSANWPSANLAFYVPIRIPSRVIVVKLWYYSAVQGAGGNVDMALYDTGGVAVVAATAAAKSTSATEAVFDVTDTTVGPGCYYLGMSCDDAVTAVFGAFVPSAPFCTAMGILVETSAYPLPATATWAQDQTQTFMPIMGLLIEATVA